MTTILLQLREAARAEPDYLVKFNLNLAADTLQNSIGVFGHDPTAENLRVVNGQWAHAARLLKFINERGDDGGNGAGLKDGAKLQEVA